VNLRQALLNARDLLTENNIADPAMVAEVLLRHVLSMDRTSIYQNMERELTAEQENTFFQLVQRHIHGEPVPYITGHREFFGIDFIVNPRVLIPRPETELLVEKVLDTATVYRARTIADIGTGCGAIAVVLALKLPETRIYAVDISSEALETARLNAGNYRVRNRIQFLRGDLLEPLPEKQDIIVANLPYVRTGDLVEPSIRCEPQIALNGGPEGISIIQRLILQSREKLNRGGFLSLEIGMGQTSQVRAMLKDCFAGCEPLVLKDLAGIERVIWIQKRVE